MDEQITVYSIGLLKACQWCNRGMGCDDCVLLGNRFGEEALSQIIGEFGIRSSSEKIREKLEAREKLASKHANSL